MINDNVRLFDLNDSFTVKAKLEPDLNIIMLKASSLSMKKLDADEVVHIGNGIIEYKPGIGGKIKAKFGSENGEPTKAKKILRDTERLGDTRLTTDEALLREKNNTNVYDDPIFEDVPEEDKDIIHGTDYFDILWKKGTIQFGEQERYRKFSEELGINLGRPIDLIESILTKSEFELYHKYFIHCRSFLREQYTLLEDPKAKLSPMGLQYLPYALASLRHSVDVGIPFRQVMSNMGSCEIPKACLYKLPSINAGVICK